MPCGIKMSGCVCLTGSTFALPVIWTFAMASPFLCAIANNHQQDKDHGKSSHKQSREKPNLGDAFHGA
jgi:hypothetical protein